ncbi:hypothetical protein SAMN05192551_101650 [Tindallia magadiensis]|uniref:Uncharacterized protein n=1 Tax=Tindallia magadiensis TaxID=69895 RepID=A0A1I3B8C6_9FIRM|nr:hypothetical protein [Tindallia magadiensis]SFH58528.1 hypothetical protein SAMN05192551_101650 [Tindallia magadiensis]
MKVKTEYQGYVIEFNRSLSELTLRLDGEIRDRKKGNLRNHKIDITLETIVPKGNYQGSLITAKLVLGLLTDTVFIYFDHQLISQKKIL